MSERTSGRRRRPLVLLVAVLALGVSAAHASGAARPRQAQPLVTLLSAHEARSGPSFGSAPLQLLPAKTPITEGPTVLPVLARHGAWLKVRLPGRPNGHTGWIGRGMTVRSSTLWHLVVSTSRRHVDVYRAGRLVRVLPAVVGAGSTPTPHGEYFVEESIALRSSDVGAPYALALSARSEVLQEFDGGPGQIALHGLSNVGGVLGTAASHGCVRLADSVMTWLAFRVGPGAPVTITG